MDGIQYLTSLQSLEYHCSSAVEREVNLQSNTELVNVDVSEAQRITKLILPNNAKITTL